MTHRIGPFILDDPQALSEASLEHAMHEFWLRGYTYRRYHMNEDGTVTVTTIPDHEIRHPEFAPCCQCATCRKPLSQVVADILVQSRPPNRVETEVALGATALAAVLPGPFPMK